MQVALTNAFSLSDKIYTKSKVFTMHIAHQKPILDQQKQMKLLLSIIVSKQLANNYMECRQVDINSIYLPNGIINSGILVFNMTLLAVEPEKNCPTAE